MAEFVPGFNQLSFDPNSFAGSSQISGEMKSFSNLKFNALFGGETKTLIMKNYHDIGTRLSYVILSTDDSLDPDKATELTTILEYELQENEFLVSVELHGRNPTAQVGNMHQIFIKNLRSWDFYSSKDGDKDPREVRVCFSAAKEPVIKSFTFSTSGRDKGLESFIWNGTKYSCDSTELYQTPFILYQPSLALKYKHDNIAYTMDDAANVKTTGKQKITGLKVFEQQPEVTVEPSKDSHLVTKGYFDKFLDSYMGTPKKRDLSLSVISQAGAENLEFYHNIYTISFTNFKIYLPDGRRLDPLYLEQLEFSVNRPRKRVVLTLNTQEQDNPQPTNKTPEEMDAYQLQDGEFFATFISGYDLKNIDNYFFKPRWDDVHPWGEYYKPASHSYYTDTPLVVFKLIIHDIDLDIGKCSFDAGSGTYLSKYYAMELSDGVAQTVLKEYKTPQAGTLVFDFGGLSKFVNVDGDQVINDVKTFAKAPQSTSAPLNDADLVNKKYIDESINGIIDGLNSDGTITVTGLVKGSNNAGSYCGFSYFKWLLKDGTRLDLKMVENVAAASATDPVLAVWHVVKDLGAQISAPEKKSKQEIQDYELQDGEFKGTLSYFKAVGKYGVYTGEPWDSYIGSGITGQHEGLLGFTIEKLNIPFKGITFTVGNKGESWSYNFHTLQFTGTVGKKPFDVNYGKTAANNEVVEVDLPSDTSSNKVPAVVTLKTEQAIAGKKLFTGGVQSSLAPVAGADLVNKDYVDNKFLPAPVNQDFKIEITCEGNSSYVAYSELKINLTGGKVIEPLYLEKREARPDNNIYRFVYKISDASAVTVKQTPRKSSSEMDAYQLQDGEYIGHLYYVGHFNSACSMNAYDNQTDPWYGYLFNGGSGKLTMCQIILSGLPNDVTGIAFKSGDKHNSFGYKSTKYGAKFTYGAKAQEHELANAQATHEFLADYNVIGQEPITNCFMELVGDQFAKGVKTFAKPPKSSQAPAEDNDLANKKYVDDELAKLVARIAALEAAKP